METGILMRSVESGRKSLQFLSDENMASVNEERGGATAQY